jgi:hypothetical protein
MRKETINNSNGEKTAKKKEKLTKEDIFISSILKYYLQFCMQKGLESTVDSFTGFIFHEV